MNSIEQIKHLQKEKDDLASVKSRKYRKCHLIQMVIKECVLHDIKTSYIPHSQVNSLTEDDIIYWNLNFYYDSVVMWLNCKGMPFSITNIEDFSSGLFIRNMKMICFDKKYICPYDNSISYDEGRFIEFCNVCGESCCEKCRFKIRRCRNCYRDASNYSISLPSNNKTNDFQT